MIKYKGKTSDLLKEISLKFGSTVNLKSSEYLLKKFFHKILKESSAESSIIILSNLPSFIKPFCNILQEDQLNDGRLYIELDIEKSNQLILEVLFTYIPAANFEIILNCLPEKTTLKDKTLKKEGSMAA